MGGEVSTDFKSSNRIEISRLVQVLLNFEWFRGSPLGDGGWVDGGGGWWEGASHPRAHARARTHAHAHARTYDIIGNSQVFPQWGRPFAWNYHVYHTCVCVRARACVHVRVCRGHPPSTSHPHPPTHPTPRAAGSPKHQNSISLELIEIIQFCWRFFTSEHSWTHIDYSWSPQTPPPTCPTPPEPRKHKMEELQ